LQVTAEDSDTPQTLSAARLRTVLAVLLWRANQPVPVDELADLVWDGAPPDGAREAIRALVMRLRRRLDTQAAARIVTRAPGYAIEVSSDELDASRFETLTHQADSAIHSSRWAEATRAATSALGLWRGTPLVDVPSQLLRDRWVPILEQLHAQALTRRIEAGLQQGDHEELIPQLRELTAHHPLRESFHSQLMLALARSGRRAEALAAYHVARRALAAELGIDPSPELRRLQERILAGDAGVTPPPRVETEHAQAAHPSPAQLPPDIAGFASRQQELAWLDRSGIALVHGAPGVGKTALAVHWAQSVSARYPDGQLFLRLRGHHPTLDPMSPTEALGRLLGSLGVRWMPLTRDPDEGANLWRSTVVGRRLLIVLDDAVSADQVRPLLPGAPGCTVLVTSRHYLAELVVHDGAGGLVLDVLPADSAITVLGSVAGTARVESEPDAAAAVAAACGHLPLALRLAGAVLAGAPGRRFAELVDEFGRGDRLAALEGLVRPSAVESAFELSYRVLPGDAKLLFRRLGLHPGSDTDVQGAALLAGFDGDTAGRLLRTLAEAHLVEPARPGRYRMHDLLRDYAARLATGSDGATERDAARRRLLDWYVDRALAVSERLDRRQRSWVGGDRRSSWEPSDDEAAGWLEAEHRNVIAAIEYDARYGTGWYAWTLVELISSLLFRRQDVSALMLATDAALAAAERQAEPRAEGAMCLERGWLRWRGGQSDGAAADFARARPLFRDAGARRAEASALRALSASCVDAGRPDEARRYAEQALAIYRAEDDPGGQAATLSNLAVIVHNGADFAAGAAYLEEALPLLRQAGRRASAALTLANLAHNDLVRGAIARAIARAQEAVAGAREIGDDMSESASLVNGAFAYEQAGRFDEAHRWATEALALARKLGYPFAEAVALNAVATTARRLGHTDAGAYRSRAVRRARETGRLGIEAEVLVGAARDAYQDAVDSTPPDDHALRTAHDAARRASDAAVAAGTVHEQAEALGLLAACDLGLGKVADALECARQAVEMHVASGARLAEVSARCVLAHTLFRSAEHAVAREEWRAARDVLDELAVPQAAPVRGLLAAAVVSPLPPSA
jgi:DNA-binding SARP family transcriptional activator